MPRKPGKVPAYCLHKRSGQAVVRIEGIDRYLGRYGTPGSHERYERAIAQWRADQAAGPAVSTIHRSNIADLTVSKVLLAFAEFAKSYYSKDGRPTKEYGSMQAALRPLRAMFGSTPASEFGPKRLTQVREKMIADGLCRRVVNARVNRIKRFFKWGVAEELVPPSVLHGLQAIRGLAYGRTTARETEPVRPVPNAWVEAVLPFVSAQVAAMIELQRLTAMRPCEVVQMRACDIDMQGETWIYEPQDHKNRWRGHRRLVAIGPRAQAIVRRFLKLDTSAYLFSPRDSEAERNQQRRLNRQSKLTPSQAARRAKARPKRAKRCRYDTDSYRRAITYGIKRANKQRGEEEKIPNWYPLQLRHSRATEVRHRFGLEAAQVSLGHARADVTQIYAQKNLELAIQIARETG